MEPFFPGDFSLSVASLQEHYQGLDLAHARTTNLCEPLLFITNNGVCHLIDGWHRLAHGLMQNVSALPAHVLSERERDAIQVARFPKAEGRNVRFLFSIGKLVLTPGASAALQAARVSPTFPLWRHITGDWGEVPEEDKQANDAALKRGGRLFSAYALANGDRLWIITESDRSVTTLLTPDEY